MSNPAKAAKAAVPEPTPRPVPEFAWEIDQNGYFVLQDDFFTNLKGKRTKCLPADWFGKKQQQQVGSSIAPSYIQCVRIVCCIACLFPEMMLRIGGHLW